MRVTAPPVTIKDIWDALTVTYGAAGTYGLLMETNLDSKVSLAKADLTTLETRLSAARATALDELLAANIPTDLTGLAADIAAISVLLTTEIADILADVTGIAGEAMRGTDSALLAASYTPERGTDGAALASAWTAALATALGAYTAAKAAYLDAAITDLSARVLPEIDDTYNIQTINSSATKDVYGDWEELIANVGAGKTLLYIIVSQSTSLSSGKLYEVEAGEGAGGSEAAITRVFGVGTGSIEKTVYPVFRALSDNARLSVRVRDELTATPSYMVTVMIV